MASQIIDPHDLEVLRSLVKECPHPGLLNSTIAKIATMAAFQLVRGDIGFEQFFHAIETVQKEVGWHFSDNNCPRCERPYRFEEEKKARICAVCIGELNDRRTM